MICVNGPKTTALFVSLLTALGYCNYRKTAAASSISALSPAMLFVFIFDLTSRHPSVGALQGGPPKISVGWATMHLAPVNNLPVCSLIFRKNWCQQMSDFNAKMHQIRFSLRASGPAPDPAEGAYSASSDPLAVFKGFTYKERAEMAGRGGDGEVKGTGEEVEGGI